MKTRDRKRRFILPPAISERNHLLLLVALFFLLGCISIFHISAGAWLWAVVGLGAALLVFGRRAGLALALCAFALGALYANAAFDVPMPEGGVYEITATVYGGVKPRTDDRISFVISEVRLNGEPVSGKGYCSLHYDGQPPALFDGARIRFTGRVYQPDGKSGEPHMDFRLWMRQHGLSFGVAAYRGLEIENTPDTAPAADRAYRVRKRLGGLLESAMGENSRVAMALLFGERDGLSEREYDAFQDLGIAHIMSVSGLHVGLVGGLALGLLRRLRVRRGVQLGLMTLLLGLYCAVTGFSAAANRAAVMLILSVLSHLRRRAPDRLTLLGAALLAVLLLNPLHATSAGFVLSFCAMLGIILYIQPLSLWLERLWPPVHAIGRFRRLRRLLHRLQRGVQSTLAVSLTAQLGVLIPTMVYFHQLPLYGVLVNLLIVPLVSAVLVPLYTLTLPAALLPPFGRIIGWAASVATTLLLRLVELLSALPHAAVRVARPPDVLAFGLGAALILLSRRVSGSLRRRGCAAALTVLVALGGVWAQKPAELRYIQLAVGQADSGLLMDGHTTVLIDTGADGYEALDYLLDENRNLDALILTHLHSDHAGGVGTLLDHGIRIGAVYLPVRAREQQVDSSVLSQLERLEEAGVPIYELASGDELRYNKAVLRVLWPERATVRAGQDANRYPLVLAADLDGYTLLLTSDLIGAYESRAAVKADVLKAAHHGSADGTREAFLEIVSPAAALISASSASRVLPGEETLRRLAQYGVSVFRTDASGDVTLSVQDGELSIIPYKENVP